MDSRLPPSYAASPIMMATPLYAAAPYPSPPLIAASPFTTSYAPLQTVSTVSGASSHASVKQHSRAEVVARTVHLRCLPPFMLQKELADVFDQCGEYLRVRICGNAATHQKWVYGFVEFASPEAAAAMLTHSGMELSNGADKPPLRLKCSPSKQPILDCMAYDADVIGGTPCGFGRGYLAECTLNDALLVVGNGTGGAAGSVAGSASTTGGASDATVGAASVSSTNAFPSCDAVVACACGCNGANCCACCPCRQQQGVKAQSPLHAGPLKQSAGGVSVMDGSHSASLVAVLPVACMEMTMSTSGISSAPKSSSMINAAAAAAAMVKADTIKALFASPPTVITPDMDAIQQLAAAFQGLRSTAAAQDGQLDGPAIVRRAETMALDALTRASHLSSDTRIQDILCDLAQLLGFLDANAAVTGGAAQTASGDCTATLPQRVTQLRMLANLVGALLCLLRRSVADAVPYVEAVLVTFAQIPPSALLLRARQHEKTSSAGHEANKMGDGASALPNGAGMSQAALVGSTAVLSSKSSASKREHLLALSRGAFIDEEVTDALLDLIDDDDDNDDAHDGQCEGDTLVEMEEGSSNEVSQNDATHQQQHHQAYQGDLSLPSVSMHEQQQQQHQQRGDKEPLRRSLSSASVSSDDSVAYLTSADMADLLRQDTYFSGYTLNVLVSVGLAMEEVHPSLARSAYTLANKRAIEVFGFPSHVLVKCLEAAQTTNPHLREELFEVLPKENCIRDITFFPRRFFESVRATWVRVRDTRGTDGFYRLLPPNYVVPLFQT